MRQPDGREELKAIRLSSEELAKVNRLSALAGKPGNFSEGVRWLIRIAPEPEQLAQLAMKV